MKIDYKNLYTRDECYKESLNYDKKTLFKKESPDYYKCSEINGWLNDCRHLRYKSVPLKNRYSKFECYTLFLRYKTNFRNKAYFYYKCAEINGWLTEFKELKRKPIKNYTILQCAEISSKYNSKSEFAVKEPDYFLCANFNGWLKDITKHMKTDITDVNHWTRRECNLEALKYNNRQNFEFGSPIAYNVALKKGWLDKICAHMETFLTSKSDYNKKRCEVESNRFFEKEHFKLYSPIAYNVSLENGWLDEFFPEKNTEIDLNNPTKEMFIPIGLKYSSINEFIKKEPEIFEIVRENDWIESVCKHIPNRNLPPGYWTKNRCAKIAMKYSRKIDLKKNARTVYNVILDNNWMDELCFHMPKNFNSKDNLDYSEKLEKWMKTQSRKKNINL